ncbi:MAG: NAD-dependent epimerase/dehydratase family protein [Myxococcales bacterium]|nr:NAD-dependent epimerase/dehydratase family protein [Myxococcales bacterium]
MTVVVTGASGHVGANLVRSLLDQGRQVRAVLRGAPIGLEGLDIEHVQGDVRDRASLERAFAGAEVVFHLAAVISIMGDKGGAVRAVNVEGVRNAAEAALAAGVRRLVHVSSIHSFDLEDRRAPLDETRPRATEPHEPAYNLSKYAGEQELRRVIERGLDATIVNPTGIIGPHDYRPSRTGRLLLSLYRRRLPALIPGGFDFVDVRDVVAGILAAEERGGIGENYILGGRYTTAKEIGQIAHAITGRRPPRLTSPMWLARATAPFSELAGKAMRREPLYTRESLLALRANPDIRHDRAAEVLGYRPRPIEETIRDSYACFARRGVVPADAVKG